MAVIKYRFHNHPGYEQLVYDFVSDSFETCTKEQALKYLKGAYDSNYERFVARFLESSENADPALEESLYAFFRENFDHVQPFTYAEAFALESEEFRALVFQSIDVPEMIHNLGHERVATDGLEVTRNTYSQSGEFLGEVTYHNVYEVHRVNSQPLGVNEPLYALRCWCTSTNQEHWLWLDDYYEDPLEAVASTFRVYRGVLPYIHRISRQGDLLFVELTQNIEVDPDDELVKLDKSTYFNYMSCEA